MPSITVYGPDGQEFEFPEGTTNAVVSAAIARHYGQTDTAVNARTSAATVVPEALESARRTAWDRFGDNLDNTFNTSWIMEGWREGYRAGAEGFVQDNNGWFRKSRSLDPGINNPAAILGDTSGVLASLMFGREKTTANADLMMDAERQRRAEFAQASEADPFWEAKNPFAHAASAFGGVIAGAALDPLSYLSAGSTILARAATQFGVASLADMMAQGSAVETGLQDKFSLSQNVISGTVGAAFNVGLDLSGRGLQKIFDGTAEKLLFPPELRPEMELAEAMYAPNLTQADFSVEAPKAPLETPKVDPATNRTSNRTSTPAENADLTSATPAEKVTVETLTNGIPTENLLKVQKRLSTLQKLIKPDLIDGIFARLKSDGSPRPDIRLGEELIAKENAAYIDWKKLDADPDLYLEWAGVIQDVYKDVYDAAGGARVSWKETAKRAKDLFGGNLFEIAKVNDDITGEGGISAKVAALSDLAEASVKDAIDTLTSMNKAMADGNSSGIEDAVKVLQRTVLIDSMAKGARSEVGRALNAMKMLDRVGFNTGTIDRIRDSLDAFGAGDMTPEQFAQMTAQLVKAHAKRGTKGFLDETRKVRELGIWDYVEYYASGNLLSSFNTALRNLVGTPLHIMFELGERFVGASLGSLRSLAFRDNPSRTVEFNEAFSYVHGLTSSMQHAFGLAMQAFADGRMPTGAVGSVGEVGNLQAPFKMTPERRARWADKPFTMQTWGEVLGWAVYSPIRTLGFRPSIAADTFFRQIAFQAQLNALSVREANYRAKMAPFKDRQKVFKETLDAIRQEPTADAIKAAKALYGKDGSIDIKAFDEAAATISRIDLEKMAQEHALMMTFTNPGKKGGAIETAQKFLTHFRLVKILALPFFLTPTRLLQSSFVERSPLALALSDRSKGGLSNMFKAIQGEAETVRSAIGGGAAEGDLALSRLFVSMGVMFALSQMWSEGNIVGKRTPEEERDGVKSYSVKLPNGTWLQFSSMSPFAEMAGTVTDVLEAMRRVDGEGHEEDLGVVLTSLLIAIGNNTFNKLYLAGFKDFLNVAQGGQTVNQNMSVEAATESVGASGVRMLAGRALPLSGMLNSVAGEIDPVMRDARSLSEAILAKIPLLSETLPAKRDFVGRQRIRTEGEVGIIQPFKTFKDRSQADVLDKELSRLATVPGSDRIGTMPDRNFNGEKVTSEEYWQIVETQGQTFRDESGMNMEDALRATIEAPEYSEAPDERKVEMLQDIITWYRRNATREMKNPNSPYYLRDIAKRTGTAKITSSYVSEGLSRPKGWDKMLDSGLDPNDPETVALHQALFPE
jgi:hypothetical protein